ncbi:MAG: T9SS type A sorting domain-containing protein [Bacteroidetes bacterium]|nr:T9SS type A sorting domain-containing protein [Bacteroidota bacterium]
MKSLSLFFILLLFIFINSAHSQFGWQLQNPKFTDDIVDCRWINQNTAFLAGFNFSLVKTTDGGQTWKHKTNGINFNDERQTIQLLEFINENTGYILTDKIYKTTNAGELWIPVSEGNIWKASAVANGVIYAVTGMDNAKLIKTVNEGSTWTELKDVSDLNFVQVKFLNALTGFFTCSPGINQKTTDGGNTWTNVNITQTGTPRNLQNITFVNNTGYGIIDGRILKSTDLGSTWIEIYNQNYSTGLSVTSENVIFSTIGGQSNSRILKSLDGGSTWDFTNMPEYMLTSFYDASHGLGFYSNGVVYKISNIGSTFEIISSNINLRADIIRAQSVSLTSAYMLSEYGEFYYTSNNGSNWVNTQTNVFLKDFKFLNENYAVGGTETNIVASSNGGTNFQIKASAPNARDFQIINQNKFYFISTLNNHSYVSSSEDGGNTINILYHTIDINNGDNGESFLFKDLKFINPTTGFLMLNESSWWRLGTSYRSVILKTTNSGANWEEVSAFVHTRGFAFHIYENTAFASTEYGLYKSTDMCQTWILAADLNSCTSIQFTSAMTGFAAKNTDIYKTTNGGSNWVQQISNGNVTKIAMYNSNLGYATGYAGTVYFTDNGGNVGITPISNVVEGYKLSQNYPNPFNPTTKINFSIPKSGLVQIKIYDMLGREVQSLINEMKTPGEYNIDFNGSNLSSGIYFYKLITNDFVDTKKMMLVK